MNKEELKNNMNKFMGSKNFMRVVYILGAIVIIFFVFHAGEVVGFRKASFSNDWGGNYERNFGPMRKAPPFLKGNGQDLPNAHGAVGRIIKVEYPNIVVLDKDQTEKVIIINDKTSILERRGLVSKDSLSVDEYVIVIGDPNTAGQIEAKLIRIIPSPTEMMNLNTSEFNNNKI